MLALAFFVILLPASVEIVYRGIVFKSFLNSSSLVPAVIVSGFTFAVAWPVFNPLIGLLLGVATALLYNRFRNVLPAIVANAVFTTSCVATLVYRDLY